MSYAYGEISFFSWDWGGQAICISLINYLPSYDPFWILYTTLYKRISEGKAL